MANPFMTAGTSVVATKSTTLPEFREFDWDFDKKHFYMMNMETIL